MTKDGSQKRKRKKEIEKEGNGSIPQIIKGKTVKTGLSGVSKQMRAGTMSA
jgi:hypothetical protein